MQSQGKYSCIGITPYTLGSNLVFVHSKVTGAGKVVPAWVAETLLYCSKFQTLEGHAEACCRDLDLRLHQSQSIQARLLELANDGLLVRYDDLLRSCDHASQHSPSPIRAVGLITRDRLGAVGRGLASLIRNNESLGRTSRFVIIDDSSEATTRETCRQLLRSLQGRFSVAIAYAGLEEKRNFALAVAELGIPKDVIHFALFGDGSSKVTTGANRNALLLSTIGDTLLSVDDDIVGKVAKAPDSTDELVCTSGVDPTRLWFFPTHDSMLQELEPVDADLLAIHEGVLGNSLAGCISRYSRAEGVRLSQIDLGFIRDIKLGRGRILATHTGLAGDCAWRSRSRYFNLDKCSHERLISSDAAYLAATNSRQVLLATQQTTITSDPAFCMSFCAGYDNRQLLPPFMPVGRNQDKLFGCTLSACFRDSYFAVLPHAVLHLPIEPRAFTPLEAESHINVLLGLNSFLAPTLARFDSNTFSSDSESNLRTLGLHLRAIGTMDMDEFEMYMRAAVLQAETARLAILEERIEKYHDSLESWTIDARSYLSIRYGALERFTNSMATHEPASQAHQTLAQTQRLVREFGDLLHWWPDLVEAARDLRDQGYALAKAI